MTVTTKVFNKEGLVIDSKDPKGGDIKAAEDGYIIPDGASYAFGTYKNQSINDKTRKKLKRTK
jgi:hypothetical protein